MKKSIFFENETEMSFWMGIYQTSLAAEAKAVSGCESSWDDDVTSTPDMVADHAVRMLRKRFEPPKGQYHNSPR